MKNYWLNKAENDKIDIVEIVHENIKNEQCLKITFSSGRILKETEEPFEKYGRSGKTFIGCTSTLQDVDCDFSIYEKEALMAELLACNFWMSFYGKRSKQEYLDSMNYRRTALDKDLLDKVYRVHGNCKHKWELPDDIDDLYGKEGYGGEKLGAGEFTLEIKEKGSIITLGKGSNITFKSGTIHGQNNN